MSFAAVALPDRNPFDRAHRCRRSPSGSWGAHLIFVAYALSSKTILTGAYVDASRENFHIPHGGEAFLLQGLVVYELTVESR